MCLAFVLTFYLFGQGLFHFWGLMLIFGVLVGGGGLNILPVIPLFCHLQTLKEHLISLDNSSSRSAPWNSVGMCSVAGH